MKLNRIIKLAVLIPVLAACDDMFEPGIEKTNSLEDLVEVPKYALGFSSYGYQNLPYQGSSVDWYSEYATDDAVSNDDGNQYRKVGNGMWSSKNGGVNPLNQWTDRRSNIQFINRFLEEMDGFKFADEKEVNAMTKDQIRGEVLALRGLQYFYFLRAHAGYVNGELMGVPLLTHSETAGDDFNVPRASFKDCIEQILKDLSEAREYLPFDYEDIKNVADIPEKYKAIGVVTTGHYNNVFGSWKCHRMSGRIAAALEAQVTLYAASPAFSGQSGITWADAAEKAAVLLNTIGGVSGMDPNGNHWYNNLDIRSYSGGGNPPQIIWRGEISETWGLETDCYPKSLFGKAKVNPTQNLVDAFPMANGYPISDAASGYDPQNPYEGRDPRFDLYIVHDGSDFGPYRSTDKVKNTELINTTVDDNNNVDALDAAATKEHTRTGYFMRKLTNEDVVVKGKDGSSGGSAQHKYDARIRYTEIFLDYAEAANEAYGPTSPAPGASYSAYDVVKALRQRGGIEDDQYLESIKSDQNKMRDLIRNERRIELCFEGHRFWDLRRWKVSLAELNEPVKAMEIKTVDGKKTYTVVGVKNEIRKYDECMFFGPVPESEINKWSALKQNDGWEKF